MLAAAPLLAVPSLAAQPGAERSASSAGAESDSAAIATLTTWADKVWMSLLDRDGAYFGRLAEEGVFQRFNPRMDHEYEVDVRSSLFGPAEDARWAGLSGGFRLAGASISHPHIFNVVDWRQEIHVAGPVDLTARYHRERSLTARRDYPWVGVRWRDVLGTPWTVRVGLGVHFFKPSADVEVALARAWRDAEDRTWSLEVRLAALDAFSEAIFQGLGVRADDVDAHYDYAGAPLAARTTLRAAASRWRAELHAGSSLRSEVRVTFPASGLGFTLREQTVTVGARARTRLNQAWAVEAELAQVRRPEWRWPEGGGSPREHRDRAVFARAALVRRPEAGWTGRLAYALLNRDAGFLAPWLTAQNQRLVTEAGHRFPSGFEVTAGLRWDVDRFARDPFDGGHLRLSAGW